jgi:hypothetical protein
VVVRLVVFFLHFQQVGSLPLDVVFYRRCRFIVCFVASY